MDSQQTQSRFASIIMLLAGIWVAISPIWISVTGGALASVIITGVIIALAGLVQYFWHVTVPSWVAGIAAVWLFISAFAFSVSTAAAWNQIIFAIVSFVLAYWDGMEVSQLQHRMTHRAM